MEREACGPNTCAIDEGPRCSYVDRRATHCPDHCCPEHAVQHQGRSYCSHHGPLIEAIASGQLDAAPLPDVTNRAPALALRVGKVVDPPVMETLGRIGGGEEISNAPVGILFVGPDRVRTWAKRWSLFSHVGNSFTVRVVVSEDAPDQVSLTLDGATLATGSAQEPTADLLGRFVPSLYQAFDTLTAHE